MSENWIESLPEPLQSAPFLKPGEDGTAKPIEQVVADLTDAAQYMGNSLRIPGPDAGEEDMASFQERVMEKIPGLMKTPNLEDPESMAAIFGKLGRPESAEGYKVPEGVELSPEDADQLKTLAHKSNLTQAQFNDYLATYTESAGNAREQAIAAHNEAIEGLKQEWGAAYDERVTAISQFLKTNKSTPPSVLQAVENGDLPADQVRWLYSLAEAVSPEDGQFHQQQSAGDGNLPPAEAMAQLIEVENRIFNRNNPPSTDEMKMLNEKRLRLMKMASA